MARHKLKITTQCQVNITEWMMVPGTESGYTGAEKPGCKGEGRVFSFEYVGNISYLGGDAIHAVGSWIWLWV